MNNIVFKETSDGTCIKCIKIENTIQTHRALFAKGRKLFTKVVTTLAMKQFSVTRISYCLFYSLFCAAIILFYLSVFMVYRVSSCF